MRQLSNTEVLSLREILQSETNSLKVARDVENLAQDEELRSQIRASILAGEARIRGIQQFISENEILEPGEVH